MIENTILFVQQKPTIEMLSYYLDRMQILIVARISMRIFKAVANEKSISFAIQDTAEQANRYQNNLLAACFANRIDVVEYMIKNAKLRFSIGVSFNCAAKRGLFEIIKLLFCHYHLYDCLESAAKCAKRSGHFRIVEWLEFQMRSRLGRFYLL